MLRTEEQLAGFLLQHFQTPTLLSSLPAMLKSTFQHAAQRQQARNLDPHEKGMKGETRRKVGYGQMQGIRLWV